MSWFPGQPDKHNKQAAEARVSYTTLLGLKYITLHYPSAVAAPESSLFYYYSKFKKGKKKKGLFFLDEDQGEIDEFLWLLVFIGLLLYVKASVKIIRINTFLEATVPFFYRRI